MKKADDPMTDSSLPPRPVRKRNPDESKRRILDAAERAFARRGFDGARLRDIAQEAGVHHALVHHYYGDKRGLFKDVVERALSTISNTGIESLSGDDVESTTTQLVYTLFDFFSTRRDLLRIVETAFRDRESVAHELTAASLAELAAPLLTHVRSRILDGQAQGRVRKDLAADAIIIFGFSLIVYPFVTGSGFMASLGVPRATDQELVSRKEQLARYIVAAIRAPGA